MDAGGRSTLGDVGNNAVNAQTVDFFLKAMEKNTFVILQSFSSHMIAVTKRVDVSHC